MLKTKLLSYNIMSGCFESYEQHSRLSNRFNLLATVLKNIDADFVGLIDTFKWRESFSEKELRKIFGYKNINIIDMEDTRVAKNIGVTVMTNVDVREFNIVRAFNRNCIETRLENCYVYTVYLDDVSEDTRLSEIQSLLEQIKYPALIHGDLNTFTREDLPKMESREKIFMHKNPKLSLKLKSVVEDMKRGEVIDLIKSKGFKDGFDNYSPTMPTRLFPAQVTKPFIRVDYMLYSKGLKVESPQVYQGDLYDKVSDHFPISLDLVI